MRNYVHFFKFKLLNYKKKLWTLGLNKCPTHRMELAGPKIQIIRFFFSSDLLFLWQLDWGLADPLSSLSCSELIRIKPNSLTFLFFFSQFSFININFWIKWNGSALILRWFFHPPPKWGFNWKLPHKSWCQ